MINLNKLSISYWNKFYKKKNISNKPTKFAVFCFKFLKLRQETLFDLGCGNGRDTAFFIGNGINTIGLDLSTNVIKNNKKKYKFFSKNFKKGNFCEFFKKKIDKKFSIYSRFTLHSINAKNEKKLFSHINKQKNIEYFFIETRTTQDEFYGVGEKVGKNEYISNHYRRFIEPRDLKKKVSKKFKIIYFKQSKSFAVYKKYKPNVLRIIAKRRTT
jgi:tellurite methyltransferase